MMSASPPMVRPNLEGDSSLAGQTVYLDFDGAADVTYRGPVTVEGIDIPAFQKPASVTGRQTTIVAAALRAVKRAYAGTGVRFTSAAPGPGEVCSTVFVGGDGAPFAAYGSFVGLAEAVDYGNRNKADNAFVFSDNVQPNGNSPKRYARKLADAIIHEVGHLVGRAHAHDEGGILSAVAAVVSGTVGGDLTMRLPFQTGASFTMNNGYGNVGDGDHNGYGVDFAMREGTAIVPIADGVVIDVNDYSARSSTGKYPNGTEMSGRDKGGVWVKVRHQGRTTTWVSSYLHFSSRSVSVGDPVVGGRTVLGYSGHSGWTIGATGDHLHLHIRNGSDSVGYRPVPMYGVDTSGSSNIITDFVEGRTYRAIDPPGTGVANDNFASSTWITGPSATINGSNAGATKESGEPNHGGVTGGKSVWFTYMPPVSGRVTVDTAGSNFDTTLGVYTGASVGSLNLIGGNDDYGGTLASQVSFEAVAGNVYRIAVDGYGGNSGSYVLRLNQQSSPITPSPFPTAPSSLTWSRTQPGQGRLNWTNTSTGESGFRLQYQSGGNWYTIGTLPAGSTSASVSAGAGSSWSLRVVRFDLSGVDRPSDPVTANF